MIGQMNMMATHFRPPEVLGHATDVVPGSRLATDNPALVWLPAPGGPLGSGVFGSMAFA
jgi:hypothetical protein